MPAVAQLGESLDPMSPVPPMTTIFMVDLHVPGAVRPRTRWRPGDGPRCDTTAVSHPGVVGGPSVGGLTATHDRGQAGGRGGVRAIVPSAVPTRRPSLSHSTDTTAVRFDSDRTRLVARRTPGRVGAR